MLHPVILDSGANYHMFREHDFFEHIHPATGKVILGDGQTSLQIRGAGTVQCKIGGHTLSIDDVRYIPNLAESIYSLFLHIRLPDHSITSSFDKGLFVHFPTFTTQAIIGTSDIYLDTTPFYDTTDTRKINSVPGSSSCSFSHYLKSFQEAVLQDSSQLDDPSTYLRTIIAPDDVATDISSVSIPIIHCVDKASSSLPDRLTFTEDILCSSIGFCRVDTMKQHLSHLYQDTIALDHTPPDAVLDIGHFATFPKTPRNTTAVPRPSQIGAVIHVDIVFGPDVAIRDIHYGLLFSDRFSRMTYVYPLKKLTWDIQKQIEYFFAHIGFRPRRLISDFDPKLIGGKARDYLNDLLIHVNAAPSGRQDRNGLAERHWQTMVAMARNWLASTELPAKFWFFAVKRAAETCNYFPMKLESGAWSTPFELAHNSKPDLRVLFKLFSLAAVRREHVGDHQLGKFDAQSVNMIAVGRCPNSNGCSLTTGFLVH